MEQSVSGAGSRAAEERGERGGLCCSWMEDEGCLFVCFSFSFLSFTDAFVRSHCTALIAALVFASAAGCGAPGSEGAHPAGAGRVSGPPGVHPGAAQALLGPHTLHHTGLDQ